jgi:hypothetical protein
MDPKQNGNRRPLPWWFYAFAGVAAIAGGLLLAFTHWPLSRVLPLYLGLVIAAFWAGWRRSVS